MGYNEELILALEDIGMTKSEIKVYLAMLELGNSTAGKIASRSNVASSKIYEILEKLSIKGFVSNITDRGIKTFTASDPEYILKYLSDKESKMMEQKNKIKHILPVLKNMKKFSKSPDAMIYRGSEGMSAAFYGALDDLKKGDEILSMNTPSRSKHTNYFFVKYAKDLESKGIKIRTIFNKNAKTDLQTKISAKNIQIKFESKYAPAAINIIGKRVIIFPEEINEPLLFVIDNEYVAQSFKKQFEESWKNLN